jgi:flagellar P-ring protein precursor FlgI
LGVSVDGPVSEFDLGDSLVGLVAQQARQPLQTDNLAAVLVTAEIPPFSKPGQRIDVNVSTIGTAESLRGGNLILTELRGIDGQVYALAQGALTVTGINIDSNGSSVQIGVPTSGRIPNGAIVERLIETPFDSADNIVFNLRDQDFSTAHAISRKINDIYGDGAASALDGASVAIRLPRDPEARVAYISDVQNLEVDPGDPVARVVINARTGTAVINRSVKVTAAAVSNGNLTVRVQALNQVSQPGAFAGGETAGVTNAVIDVEEQNGNMFVFESGVDLQDIVDAVNQVGASPSALIAILEALKRSGSLKAELVVI